MAERPRKPKKCANMFVRRTVTQTLLGAPRHRQKKSRYKQFKHFAACSTVVSAVLPLWSDCPLRPSSTKSELNIARDMAIEDTRSPHTRTWTCTLSSSPGGWHNQLYQIRTASTNVVVCASEEAMKTCQPKNLDCTTWPQLDGNCVKRRSASLNVISASAF